MTRLITLLFVCVGCAATAQSSLLAIDTLWIHKAVTDEEDLDSFFPIVKSAANPAIAHNVNTALQIQSLGYVLSDEKKSALLRQPANAYQRTNFSFAFKRLTDRFFYIDILRWHFNNSMSLNGWNEISRYYFDATSGQPVFMHDVFFNRQTVDSQIETISLGLKENMVTVMKRYDSNFTADGLAALDQDCQCNCSIKLRNAFRDGKARLDYDEASKSFRFSMDDCDWMNPRSHDLYETTVSKNDMDRWLTPYGKYLIDGGKPAANETYFKMWNGMIDGKIPTTFFFWVDGIKANEGHGLEIYDRHGVAILIDMRVAPDKSLEIYELDNNRKLVATISAKLQGGNLVGKWIKADESKTLSFTASPSR